jgi:alkylation response protein AidB-like acyl-CoA dehydrogenase
MNAYLPPVSEAGFILFDVLKAEAFLAELPELTDQVDASLLRQVLEEAGKFVGEVVAPLNRRGDEFGAVYDQGRVTTPPGFREAYQAFWKAGWPSTSIPVGDGGQGLPSVVAAVLYEWLNAANHSWTMAPGLLHGAYECIKHHAESGLRQTYLPKVASGEWLATMCLTEPHAGSDLGLVRTTATALGDGSYQIRGSKIFISWGEHDMTENIVHLVLARLPGSPPGPKGLSLFLVPKFYLDGSQSAVFCERIEEKMGLHGSPTCVMRFDKAVGWLLGDVDKGLNAMFLMMNAARLHVAMQGVGLLDAAWRLATAYAQERRQMRAPQRSNPGEPADLIIEHPAVRKLLDAQRVWLYAGKVLTYRTALELDAVEHHPDPSRREAAKRWCSLITPLLKSLLTAQAFHGASDCLQVFGGHGYVREWGIEQILRDARITMIYEGTNEIQAIDFLVRKIVADQGQDFNLWLDMISSDLTAQSPRDATVLARLQSLREVAQDVIRAAADAPSLPYEVADDFMRAAGLNLLTWAWVQLDRSKPEDEASWARLTRQLRLQILPEFDMRLSMVRNQCATSQSHSQDSAEAPRAAALNG